MQFLLLFLSILPVFILGSYIYKNDFDKEPTKLIFKLFIFGIASAFVTLFISDILCQIFPMFAADPETLNPIKLIPYAFIGVALVEEFSKWIFVYFDTYKRSEFNHAYDAIVYSVFVSLGFACIENILYVFSFYDIKTAILRALLAVPGHACDGVLMGYFLALAKISEKNNNMKLSKRNKVFSLLIPMIAHGLYDYFLFATPYASTFSAVFFVFIYILFKKAISLINQMKEIKIDLGPESIFEIDNFAFAAAGINNVKENVNDVKVDYNRNSRLFTEPEKEKYKPSEYCVICGTKVDDNYCHKCGREQIKEIKVAKKEIKKKKRVTMTTQNNRKKTLTNA